MIPTVCSEYLLGLVSYAVAIGDDAKPGLHIGEKGECSPIIAPVPQQGHGFADDVVQNVAPTEVDSVTSAWARAWLVSLGSRQA